VPRRVTWAISTVGRGRGLVAVAGKTELTWGPTTHERERARGQTVHRQAPQRREREWACVGEVGANRSAPLGREREREREREEARACGRGLSLIGWTHLSGGARTRLV
jgi:hypothetical protein